MVEPEPTFSFSTHETDSCRFATAFVAETNATRSSKGNARLLVIVITIVLEDQGRMHENNKERFCV
jgi:hypothetical protein